MCIIAGNSRKQMAPRQQEPVSRVYHLFTIWKDRKGRGEEKVHMSMPRREKEKGEEVGTEKERKGRAGQGRGQRKTWRCAPKWPSPPHQAPPPKSSTISPATAGTNVHANIWARGGGILHINHDRTGSDGEWPTQKNLHKRESTF